MYQNQIKGRNKQAFTLHASELIKAYKNISQVWHVVAVVAEEMNGKVFNKRFIDAVNERCKGVGHIYRPDFQFLCVYLDNRSYKATNGNWCYFDNELYGTSIYRKFISDTNRIIADEAIEIVKNQLNAIAERVNILEDAINNYDEHTKKLNDAVKALGLTFKEINPLFVPTELRPFDWGK